MSEKRLVFVLGGARSGKSDFALKRASELGCPGLFIATALPSDKEMEDRIVRHRSARGGRWKTLEEPVDLEGAIERGRGSGVIIIECITLWVSNLMERGLGEAEILKRAASLTRTIEDSKSCVIAVSNEVGLGIVPDNPLARVFRDVCGRVNQTIARVADEVWFLAAGVPLRMK